MPTEPKPLTNTEQAWHDLATATMQQDDDVLAVVTMIIDRRGLIRPMASTKNLPDPVGITLRVSVTDLLMQVCQLLFGKPFRCGCRSCESPEGKAMRESQVPWSHIKAQA